MKSILSLIGLCLSFFCASAQQFSPNQMDEILYAVAYYQEYMPEERLQEDIRLMKACGINTVRICESTWSYSEPEEGVFNLDWIDELLDAMHRNDLKVIVGTPTYAIPAWMARKHPEVMAVTKEGQYTYGHRQRMDITNRDYRFYAERIIRKIMERVHDHPAVIGYQVDNETKHYGTAGTNVQEAFKKHLQDKFGTTEALNQAYGLHYWSNSINDWDDLPSMVGTINGSLGSEFSKFQRSLVTDFLSWQVDIVNEYKRSDQFVTQNFDLSWRDGSYAIQENVDHFEAAKSMDVAGVDVYHDTQDDLDGVTIALAGALAWSMKQTNYLVVETQAQSILGPTDQRLHYPGQLRLQAYSHLASGANMIGYWHWHSIHNSAETYWKGILSHDLEPNPTFYEVQEISKEFRTIGDRLVNLRKDHEVAIYFSNESLTTLNDWFGISKDLDYNDIVRTYFRLLFKMNIPADFVDHTSDLSKYKVLLVPPLYVASDEELNRLNDFSRSGGEIVYTFKSGFTNENVQVRHERMPALIREATGFSYQQFTGIESMPLKDVKLDIAKEDQTVSEWAELLISESCEVVASYDHPYWGEYAAITRNNHGKGRVTYLGTWPSEAILIALIKETLTAAAIPQNASQFPIITRDGTNDYSNKIHYYFNYSSDQAEVKYTHGPGRELLSDTKIGKDQTLKIDPWDLMIVEER